MPFFRYKAVDASGRVRRGTMSAADELSLERALKAAELWLTEAQVAQPAAAAVTPIPQNRPGGGPKMPSGRKRRALIEFCTMMSYQTKVGVPMVQAIGAIASHCDDPAFREVVRGLKQELESGHQLYEAMAKYHRTFSSEFIGIVRAGELSADMPGAFLELKRYLSWLDKLVSEVKQATLYPAIVITVVCLFVVFLFAFVVPTFANLLTKLNTPLPLVTQMVFGVGDVAKKYWWMAVVGLLVTIFGARLGRRWSPAFARWLDQMKLQLPLFGPMNHMLSLSRFANNLAIMYRAGIPVLNALELCRELVANIIVAEAVVKVQEAVEGGNTLSEAVQQAAIFPPLVLRMVSVGEASGNLDGTLQEVADYYNQIVPERAKKLLTFLEPALMLFLIFIVLIVALAVYLPILSLVGNIR